MDERARKRRFGERLLIDALSRIVDVGEVIGGVGVVVGAKDSTVEHAYARYDFVSIEAEGWPRRMFLPMETAREALAEARSDQRRSSLLPVCRHTLGTVEILELLPA